MEYSNIRYIERTVYPSYMLGLQEVMTFNDLQWYCESEVVHVYQGKSWYCLVTPEEVIDLASIGSMTLTELLILLSDLELWFDNRVFQMDCRASTSMKLIKHLERKGKLKILKEESWSWEDEIMYGLSIQFTTIKH